MSECISTEVRADRIPPHPSLSGRRWVGCWASWLCGLLIGFVSMAAESPLPGPLLDGLGTLRHPVSTRSEQAQLYFNQGMRLTFAFNHKEAIRSFRSAAHFDPKCSMAWWGVALAYGPHVNKPMEPSDTEAAWAALQKAQSLALRASDKEQSYIRALTTRYQQEHLEDRSLLDRAYADGMRVLASAYPDDLNAQTLFAEALMNTMPWDYWTQGRIPRPETEEVLAVLRFVLSRDPDHPGANHLYIHAVEAGPQPELGLPSANRLLHYAPHAGHLVHMPSHIYMRVGMYAEAEESNRLAVIADENYIKASSVQGFYPGAYYPHNLHFMWWAQWFQGRYEAALQTAQRVAQHTLDVACSPNAAVEAPRFRHLPIMTLARAGRWNAVLASPEPAAGGDGLVDRAVWHWARGLAHLGSGSSDLAEQDLHALRSLADSDEAQALNHPAFPVTDTLAVAVAWLSGRLAEARGDIDQMRELLTQAVALEDALPYMEPPYWPLPVRQTLGAALLRNGLDQEAEMVFREDLVRWPRNGWSLHGLKAALLAQNKSEQASDVDRQFQSVWPSTRQVPDLAHY